MTAARLPQPRPRPPTASPARRRRDNRRRREPLRERLPSWRDLGRAAAAAGRAGLPGIAVFAIVTGAGASGYVGFRWLTQSSTFAVDHVELRGLDRLGEAALTERLAPVRGLNLFRLDTAAIERAVEANPWIADAEVRRSLPDRLVVELEEERPAGVAEMGGLYLVDAEGNAFKRADVGTGDTAGLPVVTGISRADYVAHPDETADRIRRALTVARLFRAKTSRPRVAEIAVDERAGYTLVTYDHGVEIRLGAGTIEELGARMNTFDAAWAALSDAERAKARLLRIGAEHDRVTVALSRTQGQL